MYFGNRKRKDCGMSLFGRILLNAKVYFQVIETHSFKQRNEEKFILNDSEAPR